MPSLLDAACAPSLAAVAVRLTQRVTASIFRPGLCTMDDIDESNYVEYQTMPSGKWHAAKFCEEITKTLLSTVRAFALLVSFPTPPMPHFHALTAVHRGRRVSSATWMMSTRLPAIAPQQFVGWYGPGPLECIILRRQIANSLITAVVRVFSTP